MRHLAWLLLVTGLAKPERIGEPIVRTEAARDIMLAIDLSGSMDYRDFPDGQGNKVSRFEAVQRVVESMDGVVHCTWMLWIARRDLEPEGLVAGRLLTSVSFIAMYIPVLLRLPGTSR